MTTTTAAETGEPLSAPPPFEVQGRGPTKRTITVPNDFRPVIILARWPKRAILDVRLRGEGLDLLEEGQSNSFLFDSPGSATAAVGLATGDYELVVKGTKGRWVVQFLEPDPDVVEPVSMLEQPIGNQYDVVVPLRLEEETALQWEMQSDALFFGSLIGYGAADGAELQLGGSMNGLLFEPSDRGFVSGGAMPAGDYLLVANADGNWVVEFSPAE